MAGELHDRLINELVAGGARRVGFWPWLKRLVRNEFCGTDVVPRRTFVPDAFNVSEAERILTLFEVDVRSPVTKRKLSDIAALWWTMDCEGWVLECVQIDKHGVWRELPLMETWYADNFPKLANA